MKIGEKKGNFTFAYNIDDFFCDVLFQITIHYWPNKFTIFRFIIDAYFLNKKFQKLKQTKHGFTAVRCKFSKENPFFFLGGGIFTKFGGGQFAQPPKRNLTFLENDIGVK